MIEYPLIRTPERLRLIQIQTVFWIHLSEKDGLVLPPFRCSLARAVSVHKTVLIASAVRAKGSIHWYPPLFTIGCSPPRSLLLQLLQFFAENATIPTNQHERGSKRNGYHAWLQLHQYCDHLCRIREGRLFGPRGARQPCLLWLFRGGETWIDCFFGGLEWSRGFCSPLSIL